MVCCCFRFRIPRTKQQIEADYKRRRITRKFRQQLETIQDSKMDTVSLKEGIFKKINFLRFSQKIHFQNYGSWTNFHAFWCRDIGTEYTFHGKIIRQQAEKGVYPVLINL